MSADPSPPPTNAYGRDDARARASAGADALLNRFLFSRVEFERKHLAALTALSLPAQVEIFNQSMREMDDFERLKIREMLIRLQQLRTRKTPKPRRVTA